MDALPLLTILTLTPAVGAVVLALGRGLCGRTAREIALGFSLFSLAQALFVAARFVPGAAGMQFEERHPWIPSIGVDYHVGLDGISVLPLLLAALVVPFAVAAGRGDAERPRAYHALVLLLQAGLFGAFTALDFVHWFLFWELSLVPAYFLVARWGGPARRAAATQFFLQTFVGSVAMLLAMQAVYLASGTWDLPRLAGMARSGELAQGIASRLHWTGLGPAALADLLFAGVLLGLAVKVPLMPFHTWLPQTYAEAPSGVTMILTGALSKMGLYGFLRILVPVFPDQVRAHLGLLLALATLTVVASAFAAAAQRDLKRLLAYSSANHLGLCLLGLFASLAAAPDSPATTAARVAAVDGVLLQLFNHGVTASALFAFVAALERRSGGRRGIDDFGGLRAPAPVFAGLMGIALFASLGLPGLNGFVGEFLLFRGAFPLAPAAAAAATVGLLMTAVFLLTLVQRVFAGPLPPAWNGFPDLRRGELAVLAPAVALMLVIGLAPQVLLRLVDPAVADAVNRLAR